MNQEEMMATAKSVTSLEEGYALAKEAGFQGTVEEFADLCARLAEKVADDQLDLDNMEQIAGGAGMDGNTAMYLLLAGTLALGGVTARLHRDGGPLDPGPIPMQH